VANNGLISRLDLALAVADAGNAIRKYDVRRLPARPIRPPTRTTRAMPLSVTAMAGTSWRLSIVQGENTTPA
jgi:hypothetical protein